MAEQREIGIRVALDLTEVTLDAPAGCTREAAAPAALIHRMRGLGLVIDQSVESAIAQFSLDYAAGAQPLQRVVLRATPPVKGEQGRIDWAPGFEPDRAVAVEGARTGTDHYTGRTYARITAGTHLGVLVQPGEGTPGRDVRGAELDGRGESIIARLDASIRSDAEGNLTAGKDGMLIGLGGTYRIAEVLEIPQSVDFNTGHITAAGDVVVHDGVRPGFKVTASGTLKIHGLVEAADITSQGDLSLTIGMAGAGRGTINAGADARVGYLDSVTATIHGTLIVERELVNSNVTIGGSLDARDATVFGGEIAVTDSCRIKTLGSEAFRATHIVLGDVPLLARQSLETVRALKALDAKLAQLTEKERIIRLNPRLRPVDREQLTEIAFELQELQQQRTEKMGNAAELQSAVQARRKLDVEISKAIFPNVKLTIGPFVVTFDRPVRGLVRIFWESSGKLLCRLGTAEPQPLDTIARVSRAADGPAPIRAKAA
jgi:uncharacterized protein (DUF342 family)